MKSKPVKKRGTSLEPLICPYCKEHFHFFSHVVRCDRCRTHHHDVCWNGNKACGVFGCRGTRTLEWDAERRQFTFTNIFLTCLILLGFFLMAKFPMPEGPLRKNAGTVIDGCVFFFWGLLFLLSYFYPDRSIIFRGLLWFSQNFAWRTRGPAWAIFYGIFLMVMGFIGIMFGTLGK